MPTAKVTSKGQITIPRAIRRLQGLEPGDRLQFFTDDEGRMYLVPAAKDVRILKGIVPKPRKAVSVDDMNRTIRRKAAGQ